MCRSGMRANLPHSEMDRAWKDDRPLVNQRTDAVRFALSRPPRGRGAFRYSNLGYIVVGAAIDRLAAMSFEDALRKHLLDPLDIRSLGFGPPADICGHRPRLRLGSLCLGRGAPVNPNHGPSDNPAVMTTAGRLHLGLADWARFQHLFLSNGGDVLQSDTVEHQWRLSFRRKLVDRTALIRQGIRPKLKMHDGAPHPLAALDVPVEVRAEVGP